MTALTTRIEPQTFGFALAETGVATLTLDRPERLNSLTFASYVELAETLRRMDREAAIRAVVITGAGRAFCSGGDARDIIAELFSRDMQGLVEFTRITGELIGAIRALRRPVIGAINGVAVGAGAVIALACDMRIAADTARFGFIFPKVGLCGADMGAAYLLPRVVGLGHASELLFTGDLIDAERALHIGLANRVVPQADCLRVATELATKLAHGPAFAHAMTKQMLESEATLPLHQALEAEAQAQAICMQHPDFRAAHDAWAEKKQPLFAGASARFDGSAK